jgi:hypothetical protein
MVAVGNHYRCKQKQSGFFVLRKKSAEWFKITEISTRGATFGRSPTQEELTKFKVPKAMGPAIGWNFQALAKQSYVDIPIPTSQFLSYPDKDKVEYDEKSGRYILKFHTCWETKEVETILNLNINELE